MIKKLHQPLLFSLLLVVAISCRDDEFIYDDNYVYIDTNDEDEYDEEQVDTDLYPDWTTETHSNDVDPNFEEVFCSNLDIQDEIKRIDLTISSSNWSAMWSDLSKNLGSSSGGNTGGWWGAVAVGTSSDFDPIWVPCTVSYDDTDWYQVGVRFKGNSSLQSAYQSGNEKLSLKLDFDEYEDDYPALKNQRFYGFKQLNLNNNYNDESFLRETMASRLFRKFDMAVAHTALYEVYINGDYYGLYTVVEEVDDTVIKTQFTKGGNCYKPEISFSKSSYTTSGLYLKTNTEEADYSDANTLYDALHSSLRTSDEELWMAYIESTFDVDTFLKWMAVCCTIQNWDCYGNMAHNFYLYNDPNTSQLTWIPWDHNETFQSANGNYNTYEPSEYSKVSSSWPLINYLIGVDEYQERFDEYLRTFIDEVFITEELVATYSAYETLIQASAYAEVSGRSFLTSDSQFNSAITTLKSHATTRYNKIISYLE